MIQMTFARRLLRNKRTVGEVEGGGVLSPLLGGEGGGVEPESLGGGVV